MSRDTSKLCIMRKIAASLMALTTISTAVADQRWVASDRLNRRTCPSTECGSVGQLFHREGVNVLEERNGWGRITEYYDASCRDGRSEYVDAGNAACSPSNGIEGGRFAEWVALEFVTATRPPDPAAGATGMAKVIGQSDDFAKYQAAFVAAAEQLVASGKCTIRDFEEMGGWIKSVNAHRNEPVYFTYCGGATTANRIYLNAETRETFQ